MPDLSEDNTCFSNRLPNTDSRWDKSQDGFLQCCKLLGIFSLPHDLTSSFQCFSNSSDSVLNIIQLPLRSSFASLEITWQNALVIILDSLGL